MTNLENLKNELIGNEDNFLELDNALMLDGFYSEFDEGLNWEEIAESGNIVYTDTVTNEATVQIYFDILDKSYNKDEESADTGILIKVTNVTKF